MQTAKTNLQHIDAAHGKHAPHFNETEVLHALKHYLPTQGPLKDFIHHNSLHALQHMKFYDAIFKASKVFGFQVTLQLQEYRELYRRGRIRDEVLDRVILQRKGAEARDLWKNRLLQEDYDTSVVPRIGRLRAHWKKDYRIDLDNAVQPLLFRVLCSYLDQGIALWKFPVVPEGFLASVRQLEQASFSSFFRTARARNLLLHQPCNIGSLLKILVGDEAYFEQYLFDQQFTHRGWSGIVNAVEDQPVSLLDHRTISLQDLIIFELLLEIDALDAALGKKWKPLATGLSAKPLTIFADVPTTELTEVFTIFQDAFEWSYYDEVMNGLAYQLRNGRALPPQSKTFQALFCIDERECSLRRHIEQVAPNCETMGTPGFFGVEFYFRPEGGQFVDKLCPAPVTPKYLIREHNVPGNRPHETLYTPKTHGFIAGLFTTITFGWWAGLRLVQNLFTPKMSPAISNAFAHMHPQGKLTVENSNGEMEGNLQVGFTVDEMTARVEGLLRGIGLIKDFAPIIYAIAHGSSSANNPHHGAHDCGACSGRPGSVNARVFAHMANHAGVRSLLQQRGINIPATTIFIGGLHDTAADQIAFYDEDNLNAAQKALHEQNKAAFEQALDLNAKERSRRFASINTRQSLKKVRRAILDRSVSMFEPRPELGHGTNTLCIVGSRSLTKGLFLDRRAFLNSYDHATDPEGKLLTGLMRPLGPVCGGINLEYYFSRVDNYKLGAGTKLPHNVMGLFGVANSSDGDLRPGLPLQMIEVHDPVRLLIIVEHRPEVVVQCIRSTPEMYEWYKNEWVHLMVVEPGSGAFYYFQDENFVSYQPPARSLEAIKDFNAFVEEAREMKTNQIVDATEENLPVYAIK